jgi:DNA-binding transcriptional regulator GbsR (MarR family)
MNTLSWGINRTVAQIHALLFISPKPLAADEIVDALSVVRSNVSTSLKELQGWGIVRRVHVVGDRRDHFESTKDVFEMFRIIAEERKRREIDPTLAILRECLEQAEKEKSGADIVARERLKELLGFFETMAEWYRQIKQVPTGLILKAIKLGDKVFKLLGLISN